MRVQLHRILESLPGFRLRHEGVFCIHRNGSFLSVLRFDSREKYRITSVSVVFADLVAWINGKEHTRLKKPLEKHLMNIMEDRLILERWEKAIEALHEFCVIHPTTSKNEAFEKGP